MESNSVLSEHVFFDKAIEAGEQLYELSQKNGNGYIYQLNPASGLFITAGDWISDSQIEAHFNINQMFMEIYLFESGNVTLIQNGKNALLIPKGINIYVNKTSKGRICYEPKIPVKYVSIILFKDFIKERIKNNFAEEDFNFAQTFNWKSINYNTPEVTLIFLQIKQKLMSDEKSNLYYESKVGELFSIIMSNFIKEKKRLEIQEKDFSFNELKRLEMVKLAIDQNLLTPPSITTLCQIATMGKTKLRESFKSAFNMTLGEYIRQARMKYSLVLLANKQLSIGNIAANLGYSSASKFSMAFRKVYSQSPTEYRRNILHLL